MADDADVVVDVGLDGVVEWVDIVRDDERVAQIVAGHGGGLHLGVASGCVQLRVRVFFKVHREGCKIRA